MSVDTKKLMKVPLIIAAALVILRILFEQVGAPGAVNNIFGVVWLYWYCQVEGFKADSIPRSG